MTETLTPLEPSELAGKTRADLLEMCRARGLKATAWRKEQMFAALTGQDEPVEKAPKKNVLAGQLEKRRDDAGSLDAERRKLKEQLALCTGHCLSKNGCKCEAYVPGDHDAFHWPICLTCSHTQHSHAKVEQCPPKQAAEAAAESAG